MAPATSRTLDDVAPPPAMPDWSPVRRFGGYAAWGDAERQGTAPCETVRMDDVRLRQHLRFHGHDHARAWSGRFPDRPTSRVSGARSAAPVGRFEMCPQARTLRAGFRPFFPGRGFWRPPGGAGLGFPDRRLSRSLSDFSGAVAEQEHFGLAVLAGSGPARRSWSSSADRCL